MEKSEKVLVLGATGKLGQVVVQQLLQQGYEVIALVRNPDKLSLTNPHLVIKKGDVTNTHDLSMALNGVSAVISTLGHGFRTSYMIQEKTFMALIPLMEQSDCKRLITVTGAALLVQSDPFSLVGILTAWLFPFIDPPRMEDAKRQQALLERSALEWTVVRTAVHNNKSSDHLRHIGNTQPLPWMTVSRLAIAAFMLTCFKEKQWIRQSPIIY